MAMTTGLTQVSYQRLKSFGFQERLSGVCSEGSLLEGADGALYGTTYTGGAQGRGAIFRLNKDGTGQKILRSFLGSGSDGANPKAGLVQGNDGTFYGTTYSGGSGCPYGTVYKLNSDSSGYIVLKSFSGATGEGTYPMGALVQATNGILFGTTYSGGASNQGTIFQISSDGSGFASLYNFGANTGDGAYPDSTLIQGKDGALYGTTYDGGSGNGGTVYKIRPDGTGYTILHSFAGGTTDGASPLGNLIQASDGTLYGTTFNGGAKDKGTLFKVGTDGSAFSVVYSFSGSGQDGSFPAAGVVLGGGGIIYGTTMSGGDFANGVIFSVNADGTGFTVLQGFFGGGEGLPQAMLLSNDGFLYGTTVNDDQAKNGTVFSLSLADGTYTAIEDFSGIDSDGAAPHAALVQGIDGALYGTTSSGGAFGNGLVFKLNSDGTGYQILKDFAGTTEDGANPFASLLPGTDGTLYGSTASGGPQNKGSVFAIHPDGSSYSSLHFFSGGTGDGANPHAGLIWGPDGSLYGTAASGGTGSSGVVFALGSDGNNYHLVKSFAGGANDGAEPEAALVLGSDGAFYGTTVTGGGQNSGTVFRLSTAGNATLLASLPKSAGDGFNPHGSVLQGSDGALYGTTANGGPTASGGIFKLNLDGSSFSSIYLFQGFAGEGANPLAGLIQGKDGLLYGTASAAGTNNGGTVFSLHKDGNGFTPLQAFTGNGGDGADPEAPLLQTSGGLFFGTTVAGGDENLGTIYVLSTAPPVNDTFISRIKLADSQPADAGNNFSASSEPNEPVHGDSNSPATNSVWWSWTSPASGPVTILTDGSTFNTVIDVYTGDSVSGLTSVASSTSASGSTISNRLNFVASSGVNYQIAISGTNSGFINLSVQPLSLTLQNVTRTANPDGSTTLTSSVKVGNSSAVSSSPLRLRLTARAGYSTVQGSPDPGLLPSDQLLALYALNNPSTLASGTTANVPISVVCPPPITIDPQKVGFGWGVFAILEEQFGTNWFPKDKDLLGYGLWPAIGGFIGPGGGVIRIDPAVGGSSFHPVSLTNVSVIGPTTVDAGSSARFYGIAQFSNGSVDSFTNTTWTVSPQSAGTIGTDGHFQAASLGADTPATISCYYFYDATNTVSLKITIHALPLPVITNQPANLTAVTGSDTTFSVGASGAGPLSYQWFFRSTPLSGQNCARLNLASVQPSQAGDYFVVVANNAGSATSSVATLTVLYGPIITSQPQGAILVAGQGLRLQVGVSGTPPLSFQWFVSSTVLAGAVSDTFDISNAQGAQAGSYYVVVTNAYGAATSTVARVSVLVPPSILTQPQNQTVPVGGTATFSVTTSGSQPLNYQWFFGTTPLSGQNANTLTLPNVQLEQAGSYSVAVTNTVGATNSTSAQLIVLTPPTIDFTSLKLTGSGVSVSLNSVAGLTYTLVYKNNLSDSNWTPVLPGVTGTGQVITLSDSNGGSPPARFYRILAQ